MNPFFILGCPRSGTTIIRDYIKANYNLISPEETFYYRWTFPFGSKEFHNRIHTPLAKKHRQIDGISELQFQEMYSTCKNRKELIEGHVKLMSVEKYQGWFEKTPQHVYSSLLLAEDFPDSKLLFIVRHPFNTCASLYSGRQIQTSSLTEAICYWKESYAIYNSLVTHGFNIKLIKYEEFAENPIHFSNQFTEIFNIHKKKEVANISVNPPNQRHIEILNDLEREEINRACKYEMIQLGYF